MKTLLVINTSGRVTRSITRRLTQRVAETWKGLNPESNVRQRDLGQSPPPPVNERWIAAAFSNPGERTAAMKEALALSDGLIEEIETADAIVLGAPMYNFGMPAQLKAYVDQVVRAGRTFAFDPASPNPFQPLLAPKPTLVITAAGDGAVHPGGASYHLNFLEPHLQTVFGFIGLKDLAFVRVGYDEFQDDRLKRSLTAAEEAVDQWVQRLPIESTAPR